MAFSSLGSLGSTGQTNTSTTTTHNITQACSAGDVVVVWHVMDNVSSSDGDNNEVTAVSFGAGDTGAFTQLGENTNSGGSAASGVTGSMWIRKLTGAVSNGTTLTVTHSSTTDRAVSVWLFGATGGALNIDASATPILQDASSAFGVSIATTGLASKHRLYVRGSFAEDEAMSPYTATTNFTVIDSQFSTTAAAAANNCILGGEFRINTSTGETSNPTFTGSISTECVALMYAISEAAPTVNATASAPLGSLTATASAKPTVFATAVSSSTSSATASATPTVFATATQAFGALTATAQAAPVRFAILDAPLGALASSATADVLHVVQATATAAFGALTASATATKIVFATASAPLNQLNAYVAAVPKILAVLNAPFGSLNSTASAGRVIFATATQALGALTATAPATVIHPAVATVASTFSSVATASKIVYATLSAPFTFTANAIASNEAIVYATLSAPLGALTAAASATPTTLDPVQITGLSAIRLHEIFQRLELEIAHPLVVSSTQISTDGIVINYSATSVARQDRSWSTPTITDQMILEMWQRLGLDPDNPITQNSTTISFGSVTLNLSGNDPITVTRA